MSFGGTFAGIGPQGPRGPSGAGTIGPTGATGATGATGGAGSALLHANPYTHAADSSWSIATKQTITSFTFTTGSSGRVTYIIKGNIQITNNGWGEIGGEISGVAGTEKRQTVHGHTAGPRMPINIPFTLTLTANTTYTLVISAIPVTGTLTLGALTNPTTNWLQAEVKDAA